MHDYRNPIALFLWLQQHTGTTLTHTGVSTSYSRPDKLRRSYIRVTHKATSIKRGVSDGSTLIYPRGFSIHISPPGSVQFDLVRQHSAARICISIITGLPVLRASLTDDMLGLKCITFKRSRLIRAVT